MFCTCQRETTLTMDNARSHSLYFRKVVERDVSVRNVTCVCGYAGSVGVRTVRFKRVQAERFASPIGPPRARLPCRGTSSVVPWRESLVCGFQAG